MGSGNFAVPILEALMSSNLVELTAVVSQPDKPVGRKQVMTPVPVVQFLHEKQSGVMLFQPSRYKEQEQEIIEQCKPELIIVADYGQLLPDLTINYPKYKCLNVHASLLPKYRGAVPMPAAILFGDKVTGVSIPIMTAGLDDGPVVASSEYEVAGDETTQSLTNELSKLGAELVVKTIPKWVDNEIQPTVQDENKVSLAPKEMLAKENAMISAQTEARYLERAVRAFYPWPIVWCWIMLNGKKLRLKIYNVEIDERTHEYEYGKLVIIEQDLCLPLPGGIIKLKQVQLEGKNLQEGDKYYYLAEQGGYIV